MIVTQAAAGLGQDASWPPPYVGASVSPTGQAYYAVLDDYAVAVAGALNDFELLNAVSQPSGILLEAKRVQGVGDLAKVVSETRGDRGIIVAGDVFEDEKITVLLTRALDTTAGTYVLSDPAAGWEDPSIASLELGPLVQGIAKGWRLGALVGGVAVLGLLAVAAKRRR